MSPQDVTPQRSAGSPVVIQAWDPYDVWLKRVKQPRDRLPQRNLAAVATVASPEAAPHAEPSRLVPHTT